MPLNRCQIDDGPGWKWGQQGTCYPYTAGNEESETAARKKALAQAAAMGEFPGTGQNRSANTPVEFRSAQVAEINYPQRQVEIIVTPYEERSQVPVMYRGELWDEIFTRGAFDGIESRQDQVRANRGHDRSRTVGKALQWWPSRQEGLVSNVRIAKTPLGDETLALLDENMLSASVGFAARGRDQSFDKREMLRRINRAFVDHLAFVEKPAYAGAEVVSVRGGEGQPSNVAELPPLVTPALDEYVEFLASLRRR